MTNHGKRGVYLLQSPLCFLMDIDRPDAFNTPIAQTIDMAALQFLFDSVHLLLCRNKLTRLGLLLVHHHIQGKLHIAMNTIRKVANSHAALGRELWFLGGPGAWQGPA